MEKKQIAEIARQELKFVSAAVQLIQTQRLIAHLVLKRKI